MNQAQSQYSQSAPQNPAPQPQTQRLKSRVAIVTGSSSGLGAAIALAYSLEGATVFCVDLYPAPRNPINPLTNRADDIHSRLTVAPGGGTPQIQGTHEKIRQSGGEATYHKADVTRAQDVQLAIRACVQRYGRLDIMVCNAGISVESTHTRPLRAHETSEEDYDKTMAINTKGIFLCCKFALKQMLDNQPKLYQSRGWIVNIASVLGLVPYSGTPAYCASKGAAVMLTKQIALDYARDLIHCNALCPGFLETGMTQNLQSQEDVLKGIEQNHPFGAHLGKVEDVAKAALYLASDDAAWVTGVPLPVDGGYLLR